MICICFGKTVCKIQQIENCFRSAKIERSGFLHPAEFLPEECKNRAKRFFAYGAYGAYGAKNRCALFLHSGFMKLFDHKLIFFSEKHDILEAFSEFFL